MNAPVKASKLLKGDEETLFSLGEVIEQTAGHFTPARWW